MELTDEMTLDEKLAAIDQMMANAVVKARENDPEAPFDPAELTICLGCE